MLTGFIGQPVCGPDRSLAVLCTRPQVGGACLRSQRAVERARTVYGRMVIDVKSDSASGADAPLDEPSQGVLLACVYCTHVHPGLGADCPRCHGSGPRFRPARMMDGTSAREALLASLHRLGAVGVLRAVGVEPGARGETGAATGDAEEYRTRLIGLLEEAVIYGVDLVEAIAGEIRRVEGAGPGEA